MESKSPPLDGSAKTEAEAPVSEVLKEDSREAAERQEDDLATEQGKENTKEKEKEKEKEGEKEEGKPSFSLLQALCDQGNRDVAKRFAFFSLALALVPIMGLFVTERVLRGFVSDPNTRWTYSAVVAVLLVNTVLLAFVLHCFAEGFDHPRVDWSKRKEKAEKGQEGLGDGKQTKEEGPEEPKKNKWRLP